MWTYGKKSILTHILFIIFIHLQTKVQENYYNTTIKKIENQNTQIANLKPKAYIFHSQLNIEISSFKTAYYTQHYCKNHNTRLCAQHNSGKFSCTFYASLKSSSSTKTYKRAFIWLLLLWVVVVNMGGWFFNILIFSLKMTQQAYVLPEFIPRKIWRTVVLRPPYFL